MTNNLQQRKRDNELAKSIIAAPLYDNLNIQRRSELRKSSIYGKTEKPYDNLPELVNNAITFSNAYQTKQRQLGFLIGTPLSNRYFEDIKINSGLLYLAFKSVLSDFDNDSIDAPTFNSYMLKFKALLTASGSVLLDHEALHSIEIDYYTKDVKQD